MDVACQRMIPVEAFTCNGFRQRHQQKGNHRSPVSPERILQISCIGLALRWSCHQCVHPLALCTTNTAPRRQHSRINTTIKNLSFSIHLSIFSPFLQSQLHKINAIQSLSLLSFNLSSFPHYFKFHILEIHQIRLLSSSIVQNGSSVRQQATYWLQELCREHCHCWGKSRLLARHVLFDIVYLAT